MDVRCSKCGTEYEFDDAKVKPTGVAVQCTSCGHVFKVQRDTGAVPEPVMVDAGASEDWMVRTRAGDVLRFKELTTLQKWIVEQRVHPDDQISKTGRNWKPLGEISELMSFFQVVEAANRAKAPKGPDGLAPPSGFDAATEREDSDEVVSAASLLPSGGYVRPSMSSQERPPVAEPEAAEAVAAVASSDELVIGEDEDDEVTERVDRSRSMPPRAAKPPPVAPPPSNKPQLTTPPMEVETSQVEEAFLSDSFGKVDVDELDEDDPVLQWQRKSRRRKVALVLVLLLLATPFALYFGHRPTFDAYLAPALGPVMALIEPPPPAVPDIAPALHAADADGLAAALNGLPAHPAAAPAKARLLAELAWIAVESARLTKESGEVPPPIEGALRMAYEAAQAARAHDDPAQVKLANAAYQAAKGGVNETKAEVGDAEDPEAALLLARAKFASSSSSGAIDDALAAELAALAAERPRDQRALYLDLAARGIQPPTPERTKKLQADLAVFIDQAPDFVPAQLMQASLGEDAKEGEGEGEGETKAPPGPEPAELDYGQLLAKAKRAQRAGRATTAARLFKAAAKKNPSASAPWVGLGWSYLDIDKSKPALDAFRKATSRDPKNADAQLGLAEALRYTGNKAEAIAAYKRFLVLAPASSEAGMAKNAIKALGGK